MMYRSRQNKWPRQLAVVAVLALLAACSGRGHAPDSQVAVRVNGDEITVHQVEAQLQRQPGLAQDNPERAAQQVLDSLVEQQLAVQAARERGIENEPDVVQAIEATRREVIARAFQDRVAGGAARASSDEVDAYYAAHPGLFARRRLYTLREFLVPAADAAQAERVRQGVASARSASEIEAKLSGESLRFGARLLVRAPEDLPLEVVDKLADLDVGQVLSVPQGDLTTRVLVIVHAEPAPVDRHMARDAIASFLDAERQRGAVTEAMKTLREKARIEFVGRFAAGAASAPAAAVPR